MLVHDHSNISLKIEIRRVFEQNFRVCDACNVWRHLQLQGYDNVFAEKSNCFHFVDVIHPSWSWRSYEVVEFATPKWSTGSFTAAIPDVSQTD